MFNNSAAEQKGIVSAYEVINPQQDLATAHILDDQYHRELHRTLMGHWHNARTQQAENRLDMARDESYDDGDQWHLQDATTLLRRGQAPLVFNLIKESMAWISGVEKHSRTEGKVVPRGPEDVEPAFLKQHLLKFVSDINKEPFEISTSFDECIRGGLSWVDVGIRSDPFDEPLFIRHESWRNVWYDHLDPTFNCGRSRFLFRAKWLDLDVAEAMFPGRMAVIQAKTDIQNEYNYVDDEFYLSDTYRGANDRGDFNSQFAHSQYMDPFQNNLFNDRRRSRVVEAWYRVPAHARYMFARDPQAQRFNRTQFDQGNDMHAYMAKHGTVTLHDAVMMQMRLVFLTEGGLLTQPATPYKHDRFPLVPLWCFRRKKDGNPYGYIRNMIDPQEDLNKRRSKMLFLLSTRGAIMENGAVANKQELRRELSRPDLIVEVQGQRRFELIDDRQMSGEHAKLVAQDEEFIRRAAGVTPENLGHPSNAISGKAIEARQGQGSLTTATAFDSLSYAKQQIGEIKLALVDQFYTDEKTVRILGDDDKVKFLELNKQEQDQQGQPLIRNPIHNTQTDFIIGSQEHRESVRMAVFSTLTDLLTRLPPEVIMAYLPQLMELVDVPGKERMIAIARQLSGQEDPAEMETPAGRQRAEEKAQRQAALEQLQAAATVAEVEKMQAEAKVKQADALSKAVSALNDAMAMAKTTSEAIELTPLVEGVIETARDMLDAVTDPLPETDPRQLEPAANPTGGLTI